MAKKKRNYAAERRVAQKYADVVMETRVGANLTTKEFVTRWGIAYAAYLAGLRGDFPTEAPK